jgi:hypothetical protein
MQMAARHLMEVPGPGQPLPPGQPTDPDQDPGLPGPRPPPNDIYIRKALERIGRRHMAVVPLNPSLPPRPAFLAAFIQEYAERMTLLCELADLLPRPGGEPGSVVVAGHVARFVDDVCGNGFKLRWPYPWPAPGWFSVALDGPDLVVMGTEFQQHAGLAMDRDLGRTFADAAQALLEAGAARFV